MKHSYQAQFVLLFFLVLNFFPQTLAARKDDCPEIKDIIVKEDDSGHLVIDMDMPDSQFKLIGFIIEYVDLITGEVKTIKVEGSPPLKIEMPEGGPYALRITPEFSPACVTQHITILPNDEIDLLAEILINHDEFWRNKCRSCRKELFDCIRNIENDWTTSRDIFQYCPCENVCPSEGKCCSKIQLNIEDLIEGLFSNGREKRRLDIPEKRECFFGEVSPNPFQYYTYVNFESNSNFASISLFDVFGQKLKYHEILDEYNTNQMNYYELDGIDLKVGIYYLVFESEGCREVKKLVKN